MSFISSTGSVTNEHPEHGSMSPFRPNLNTKTSGLIKKHVHSVSECVRGNCLLANSPVSPRSPRFSKKSPLSPRSSKKSPGSPSQQKVPSSTHKSMIRSHSNGESRPKNAKPRRRPTKNVITSPMRVESGDWRHSLRSCITTKQIPVPARRPQSAMTLRISTKKETADTTDAADKKDLELSNTKINSKGNRKKPKSCRRKKSSRMFTSPKHRPQLRVLTKKETAQTVSDFPKFKIANKGRRNSLRRKKRLFARKFRETRNNFISKMLEIKVKKITRNICISTTTKKNEAMHRSLFGIVVMFVRVCHRAGLLFRQ